MDGIYSVQCSTKELQDANYKIEYYSTIEETALMNFLFMVQENKLLITNKISEYVKDLYYDLYDGYYTTGMRDDIFHAAYYFFENVQIDLLEEMRFIFSEYINKQVEYDNIDDVNKLLEENSFAIRQITKVCQNNRIFNSYSTVTVPLAFVLGTDVDINAFRMQWISDFKLCQILKFMLNYEFSDFSTLKEFIINAAKENKLQYEMLNIQLQSILTRQLMFSHKNKLCSGQKFSAVIFKLVRDYLGGYYDNTAVSTELF